MTNALYARVRVSLMRITVHLQQWKRMRTVFQRFTKMNLIINT